MTIKERKLFRSSVAMGNCFGLFYGYVLWDMPGDMPAMGILAGVGLLFAANAISILMLKNALGLDDLET